MSDKGSSNGVVDESVTEYSVESERRLVRKIDWHLLPWICLLYALALIDR
jgi:hypothetical protein